jgi:protein-tyrosine phosphatase
VSTSNVGEGVKYAMQQRSLGRAVLVHCAHGHGRSAEVLLACMITTGVYKNIDEGLAAFRKLRPKCKLNKPQRANLEAYLTSAKGAD